jgi:hypothetical protein
MMGKKITEWFFAYTRQLDLDRIPAVGREPIWLTREQWKSIDRPDMCMGIPIRVYPEQVTEKPQNFCPNCGEAR